jgi:hypothetical protein
MLPTSTDTRRTRRAARHARRRRLGAALLAAAEIVPVAVVAGTRGGPSGEHSVSLAAAVDGDHLARDRASRSAFREDEPVPPKAVTVTHDGRSQAAFLAAGTVAELLTNLGISVDGDDEVTPPLDVPPGNAVTVVRVDVTRMTEERAVPVPKELRDDPALPKGDTRVDTDGSPGLERVVFEVVRRDGRVTAKRQIATETVTAARPRVVIVGRGGGRGAPADGVAGLPLKLRLAEGDVPDVPGAAAGSPGGPGGRQEGGASWYRYRPGTCAHRTLQKGTVVKVTNLSTGRTANCTVADRGPFVAGRIIDLDRSVFLAVAESGQGVVRVRIEW